MVGPKYHRPPIAGTPAFKEAPPAGWKEAQPNEGIPRGRWWEMYNDDQLNDLVDAWRSCAGVAVAVTNEVGWGLVPDYRSGRVFTDLLGQVNQEIAAASDDVILVVAGRSLRL
jgi:adenosyl cobinamide kinase/adenosyl cobinamide phosphate guanylyltransferase